eukprot:7406661-Alexandrium_andersonii.AAC.1
MRHLTSATRNGAYVTVSCCIKCGFGEKADTRLLHATNAGALLDTMADMPTSCLLYTSDAADDM